MTLNNVIIEGEIYSFTFSKLCVGFEIRTSEGRFFIEVPSVQLAERIKQKFVNDELLVGSTVRVVGRLTHGIIGDFCIISDYIEFGGNVA